MYENMCPILSFIVETCLLNSGSVFGFSDHSERNFVNERHDSFDKDITIIVARICNVFPHLSVLDLS